jgi:hypothetical protein
LDFALIRNSFRVDETFPFVSLSIPYDQNTHAARQ